MISIKKFGRMRKANYIVTIWNT